MKDKDSYQKFAEDMFGPIEKIAQNEKSAFHRVKKQDLDEVVVAFAVQVCLILSMQIILECILFIKKKNLSNKLIVDVVVHGILSINVYLETFIGWVVIMGINNKKNK